MIPTRGRPETVLDAVRSALAQEPAPLEIIVVIDGPDPATGTALAELANPRVRAVELSRSRGAGGARNAGVESARGDLIAFLDDDDTWLPGKLAAQLGALASCPDPDAVVIGCQVKWDDGAQVHIWPTRPPGPAEPIGDYLFVRRSPGEGLLPTPTLLLSRRLAAGTPMPTHLATHEEWDWLLTLQQGGASFIVVMEPLVSVDGRPRRPSITHTAGWRQSLAWGVSRAADLGDRALSAFLLTETARAAVADRAGPRAHLAIAATALSAAPRPRDLLRFAGRLIAGRLTVGRKRGVR